MICKYWDGTTHVDVGGNALFLYKDSEEEIYDVLLRILGDEKIYAEMKKAAELNGIKTFSYDSIAKRSVEDQA